MLDSGPLTGCIVIINEHLTTFSIPDLCDLHMGSFLRIKLTCIIFFKLLPCNLLFFPCRDVSALDHYVYQSLQDIENSRANSLFSQLFKKINTRCRSLFSPKCPKTLPHDAACMAGEQLSLPVHDLSCGSSYHASRGGLTNTTHPSHPLDWCSFHVHYQFPEN